MKNLKFAILLVGLFGALAHGEPEGLKVMQAWARETPPESANGVVYMMIENQSSKDIVLVGANTPISNKAELHTHLHEDGLVKMQPVDRIVIPARGHAMLKPGGDHVMLIGIKKPLRTGDMLKLELRFEDGQTLSVMAPVKKNADEHSH